MTSETNDLRLRYKQEQGDVLVKGLVASINESISNIINTMQGTRLFNRGFGAGIGNLLFEPMSDQNASILLISVDQAIERHEPRARLLFNQSEAIPDFDNNGYELRLVYQVLGREETSEYDTFLESQLK